MRFIILFAITINFGGCYNTFEKKPMKYNRHGENLSCNGYYLDSKLIKVLCFSANRDTILFEDYVDGIRNGKSEMRYPSGQIKEVGIYTNGKSDGVWKEFYTNGNLKSYKYKNVKNDTSFLIYEKQYDDNNQLQSLRFPIRYSTDSKSGFKIGKSYQLYVDLIYSEFESVHSYGYIDPAPLSSVPADTVIFEGTTLQLEFTPLEIGHHKISGVYMEIDATKSNPDIGYGGHKNWEFEYEVTE